MHDKIYLTLKRKESCPVLNPDLTHLSFCYHKGFLSSTSCNLSSYKFGVHFYLRLTFSFQTVLYTIVIHTLGNIIFIQFYALRWQLAYSLSNCLPRHCPLKRRVSPILRICFHYDFS